VKEAFVPLKITAHLANGYATYDPWSPTIDGPMAYFYFLHKLGPDRFYNQPEGRKHRADDAPLPLKRVKFGDRDFFFAASCPIPKGTPHEATKYYHKRFDTAHADRHVELGRRTKIQTKAGPFKSHRVPIRVLICPTVSWYAVGEPEGVRKLVEQVQFLGKRHAHGHGQVIRWEVEEIEEDWSIIKEGRLMRPVPVGFGFEEKLAKPIEEHCISTTIGIRPPYHHSTRRRGCLVPMSMEGIIP
jgi:CRISPR type IV-associated protein Csf3